MKRFACGAVVVLAAAGPGTGCDDAAAPPPNVVADQPAAKPHEADPARPTTQELLEEPRTLIALGELPLTVRVPRGWAVKTLAGTTHVLLEGPTPSGDASIQLNVRPSASAEKLGMIINGAKKELEQFPQSIKMVQLRSIEGAQVLERQRVGDMPRALPDDDPSLKPSRPLNWTITVFVPRGANFDTYELNFIGLTADQYDIDKPLLRGVVDSIAVQTGGPSTSATTGPGRS